MTLAYWQPYCMQRQLACLTKRRQVTLLYLEAVNPGFHSFGPFLSGYSHPKRSFVVYLCFALVICMEVTTTGFVYLGGNKMLLCAYGMYDY